MNKRKSLTPNPESSGLRAMRRGGARREVTERVTLKSAEGKVMEGWALNISRGGVRIILEEKVELGQEYEVTVGDQESGAMSPRGRIVWVQEEPDGSVVGIEFIGLSGLHQATPGAPGAGASEGPGASVAPEATGGTALPPPAGDPVDGDG